MAKDKKRRDLEKEREQLLKRLAKESDLDVLRAISIAVAALPSAEAPKVSSSTEGASNADS